MPVETAADRAGLFSTDEFAEWARYTAPGGEAVICTIVYDRGRAEDLEVEMGAGGMRAAIIERHAEILADQVPVVVMGATIEPGRMIAGVFVAGGELLKIVTKPRLDETGATWSADLQKVGP